MQTRSLYAGAHRMTSNRLAVLDLPEANAMRAPNEAPGLAALEIAMDEMAEKLGMDPIEFRIVNDTQVVPDNPAKPASADPQSKAPQEKPNPHPPFSQRQLVECFRVGAKRFGWDKRNAQPGQVRDGRWLVGMGVAAAFRDNLLMKSAARVRLDRRGIVTVETDMTDIGTGSYTVIAQTAAEMMGVPLDKVVVRLGDSSFPVSCGSGGQWGGNSSTAGVYAACMKLREAVAQKAGFNAERCRLRRRPGALRIAQHPARRGGRRSRPRRGRLHRIRRPRQALPAIDVRRAFRRSRRRCRDRRDARAAHARRLRRRAHPQPQDRAQPGDRRDDDGRGRGADGRARGGQALRLLREPRSRGLRSAGACRHPAPGGDLPRRDRSRSRRR